MGREPALQRAVAHGVEELGAPADALAAHVDLRDGGAAGALCQDGADEMGVEGFTFRDILQFYYPGTSVSRLAKDIAWKRLSSGATWPNVVIASPLTDIASHEEGV